MSSKQRVFSHENTNHYSDYLKIKQGERLLPSYSKNPQEVLSRFTSYQDFLNSTKAYYQHKNNHLCSYYPLMNMYQTNTSFTTYEKITKQPNSCESLTDQLYPYGTYVSNTRVPIYFPNNIHLHKWCSKNKALCDLNYYIDPSLLHK
jgi:ADP-glucose pyrophosphorylase